MEHDLRDKDEFFIKAQHPILITGFEEESAEVTIKSISQVVNVNALASDQLLKSSNSGLTIIYGDNGAGKSSYSRVLKHGCLARGKAPLIIGNVFEKSNEPSSALLSVMVDGEPKEKSWNIDFNADSDLKSIRVFDGEVADNFVTGEDELGYKPAGLHLLKGLVSTIDFIKRRIDEECMGTNGLVQFPEFGDTKTGEFIRTLSANIDLTNIEKYLIKNDEEEKTGQLKTEISDLKAKSPAELKKELINKKQQLVSLKTFIGNTLSGLNNEVYENLKAKNLKFFQKELLAEDLREKLLGNLPLTDIGGKEWQSMWNAANQFIQSLDGNKKFPPQKDEDCPLCLQNINEDSALRLVKFNEFLLDQTSKQANQAKRELLREQEKILGMNIDVIPYQSAISLIEEAQNGFLNDFNNLIEKLEERKNILVGDVLPETLPEISLLSLKQIKSFLKKLKTL